MPTIAGVVGMTRGLLNSSLGTEVSTLAESYAGGDRLTLTGNPRIGAGTVMCINLQTVQVVETIEDEVFVVPGVDGSAMVTSAPQGTPVLIKPRHTTWSVFTEIVATIAEISAPSHGLYAVVSVSQPSDTVWSTYPVEGMSRILRVRYLQPGSSDDWRALRWTYQPAAATGPAVIAPGAPGGTAVQIIGAGDFTEPTALSQSLSELNIPDSYATLLALGAARNLSLASESRRAQPFSQGDPRRAEEVPSTANVVVYDRLARRFTDLVDAERTRLIARFPYTAYRPAYPGVC